MTQQTNSYQQQQDKLAALLDRLQSDDLDVDEALKVYDEAVKLIQKMEQRLDKAKNHVEELRNRQV